MVKCKNCIFCIDEKCNNPESDEYGMKVFGKYDMCREGRKSTVGISALQRFELARLANRKGGERE